MIVITVMNIKKAEKEEDKKGRQDEEQENNCFVEKI